VDVRQAFPSAPDADDLAPDFVAPIDYGFDYGIQTRHVAAAGEDTYTLSSHEE
jgi:hypothetical protein